MPLSTTYLLPAILLNPAFILHLVNTLVSHILPHSTPVMSDSPHPLMESFGPVPGTTPYWDMHVDDASCWRYTAIMVVVQVLAFGRVQDNRAQRRERRAAKAERESDARGEVERAGESVGRKSGSKAVNHGVDGMADSIDEEGDCHLSLTFHEAATGNLKLNGAARTMGDLSEKAAQTEGFATESEASLTETSEEEMMI